MELHILAGQTKHLSGLAAQSSGFILLELDILTRLGPSHFHQHLDGAVRVEFTYICHRLPTANPPAAQLGGLWLPPRLTLQPGAQKGVAAMAAATVSPLPATLLPPSLPDGENKTFGGGLAT